MKKLVAILLCLLFATSSVACFEKGHYEKATELLNAGQYAEALTEFEKAGEYENAVQCAAYSRARIALNDKQYADALAAFETAGAFGDAAQYAAYARGVIAFGNKKYADAVKAFQQAGNLEDSEKQLKEAQKWVSYEDAVAVFDSGDYKKAREAFQSLGNMEKSEEYVLESTYRIATAALKEGKYLTASEELETLIPDQYKDANDLILNCAEGLLKAKDYDKAEQLIIKYGKKMTDREKALSYISAMRTYSKGDTAAALKTFRELKGYRDCDTLAQKIGLQTADKLFKEKKYADAKKAYGQLEQTEDVKDKIKYCDFKIAEQYYKDGKLNQAKKLYEALGTKYSKDGVKVSDRLKTLKKYDAFVKICGQWKATAKNTYWEVKQKGQVRYWYWYNGYESSQGVIDVYCTINKDGTVTIHGTAGFYRYLNYSSYSAYLRQGIKTVKFSKKVKNLSNKMSLLKDKNTSITYSNGPKFKLEWSYTDNTQDVYFKYIYTSKYTYTKKVKAY